MFAVNLDSENRGGNGEI